MDVYMAHTHDDGRHDRSRINKRMNSMVSMNLFMSDSKANELAHTTTGEFELGTAQSTQHSGAPVAAPTSHHHFAIGITEGPAPIDEGSSIKKEQREAVFPARSLQPLLDVRIEAGAASSESDRRYLLNALADRSELAIIPLAKHTMYDVANAELRGFFAARVVSLALKSGDMALFDGCLQGLRTAQTLREVSVSLSEAEDVPEAAFDELIRALPKALESFALADCKTLYNSALLEGIGRLQRLKTLSFAGGVITSLPDSLTTLDSLVALNLGGCRHLTTLPPALGSLAKLKKLILFGCSSLTQLPGSIINLDGLEVLDLRQAVELVQLPDLSNLQYLQNVGRVFGDTPLFDRWERRGRKKTLSATLSSMNKSSLKRMNKTFVTRAAPDGSKEAATHHAAWSTALYGASGKLPRKQSSSFMSLVSLAQTQMEKEEKEEKEGAA